MFKKHSYIKLFAVIFSMQISFVVSSDIYADYNTRSGELADQCAKRTSEIFNKDYPIPTWKMPDGNTWSIRYEKHYNSKLSKCFMLIKTIIIGPEKELVCNSHLLLNVDENREYGEFLDFRKSEITCYLLNKSCRNKTEWDVLAEPYMSE